MNYQFKDALNSLSVAVQAGYSVENAVTACMKDMERLYPPEADIVREFHYIESRKKVSVPVEELFLGLGERSGIEDLENPFGVCAMTVCLGIYGLSYWLGKRIVDIEV